MKLNVHFGGSDNEELTAVIRRHIQKKSLVAAVSLVERCCCEEG